MSDSEGARGGYVRKLSAEIRRYAQDILEDNRNLHTALATLKAEEGRWRDALVEAQETRAENERLRETLRQAHHDEQRLQDQIRSLKAAFDGRERERLLLEQQLSLVDRDNRRFMDQFVVLERQTSSLANLYVASYRLHETLDRQEVINSLQEILANLVGSEEMALFELDPDRQCLRLVASQGIQAEAYETLPLDRGRIGAAIRSGETFVVEAKDQPSATPAEPLEQHLTACIPLKLEGRVTGAIAVFRLLPQKPGVESLDFEIFDLLGSQAAMALYCTALHSRVGSVAAT
jgi:hypothetical protein